MVDYLRDIDTLNYLNFLFVAIILILGIIILREDIHKGKIKNKWILSGLKFGIVLYLIMGLWSILGYFEIPFFTASYYQPRYFLDVFLNFFCGIIFAYLFWQYHFWSAGDAKMFILFSFLIPSQYYADESYLYFPAFVLLVNIFIPPAALFTISAFIKIIIRFLKYVINLRESRIRIIFLDIKTALSSKFTYSIEIYIFLSSIFLSALILPILRIRLQTEIRFLAGIGLIIFIGFQFAQYYLSAYIKKLFARKIYSSIFLIFIGIYLVYSFYKFPYESFFTVVIGLSFNSLRYLIKTIAIKYGGRETISINDLKAGMVVSEDVFMKFQSEMQESKQNIGDIYAEGLDEKQVEIFKEWFFIKESDCDEVNIYKTISFAPWIFAGVVITLILKQSVVHYFLSLIKNGF